MPRCSTTSLTMSGPSARSSYARGRRAARRVRDAGATPRSRRTASPGGAGPRSPHRRRPVGGQRPVAPAAAGTTAVRFRRASSEYGPAPTISRKRLPHSWARSVRDSWMKSHQPDLPSTRRATAPGESRARVKTRRSSERIVKPARRRACFESPVWPSGRTTLLSKHAPAHRRARRGPVGWARAGGRPVAPTSPASSRASRTARAPTGRAPAPRGHPRQAHGGADGPNAARGHGQGISARPDQRTAVVPGGLGEFAGREVDADPGGVREHSPGGSGTAGEIQHGALRALPAPSRHPRAAGADAEARRTPSQRRPYTRIARECCKEPQSGLPAKTCAGKGRQNAAGGFPCRAADRRSTVRHIRPPRTERAGEGPDP